MNPAQLTIDFSAAVHRVENNPISQSFLDEHRELFGRDCFEVLKVLINEPQGLTVEQAMSRRISGHLPSRIRDLSNTTYGQHWGIPISKEKIKLESGRSIIRYYMTSEDKVVALQIIMKKLGRG